MIYDLSACDPWQITLNQSEYIIWAVSADKNLYDPIDNTCKKTASRYLKKIFLRLVIDQYPVFASNHKINRVGDLCRVKRGKPYWWMSSPGPSFIRQHMSECAEKCEVCVSQTSIPKIQESKLTERDPIICDKPLKTPISTDQLTHNLSTLSFKQVSVLAHQPTSQDKPCIFDTLTLNNNISLKKTTPLPQTKHSSFKFPVPIKSSVALPHAVVENGNHMKPLTMNKSLKPIVKTDSRGRPKKGRWSKAAELRMLRATAYH